MIFHKSHIWNLCGLHEGLWCINTDNLLKPMIFHNCIWNRSDLSEWLLHVFTIFTNISNMIDSWGKLLTSASNLRKHIKIIHKVHKDYKCDCCGKSFCEWFWWVLSDYLLADVNNFPHELHLKSSWIMLCVLSENQLE